MEHAVYAGCNSDSPALGVEILWEKLFLWVTVVRNYHRSPFSLKASLGKGGIGDSPTRFGGTRRN